ncbi:MAG: DUF2855 family protein [Mycobacterium sp.]
MTRSNITTSVLEVSRSNPFADLRLIDEEVRPESSDSVLLAVDRFGLATNNLGYALLGDVLKSWDAFPSPTPGWGRVPVWGAARVLAAPESIAPVGATLTGYLPMATHVVVRAKPIESGLLTVDEPRAGMLEIYRRLTLDETNQASSDHEIDVDTVMLAVYPFASLLAHDLSTDGARSVLVSSASSRSAASLSRLLLDRGVETIGLTSPRNRAAVETMGVYSRVFTYEEVGQLPDTIDTVYVDVAGSTDVTNAVQARLGARLVATVVVGGTHLRSWPPEVDGASSVTVFNTGDREQEIAAEHGQQFVEAMYRSARRQLVAWATPWMQVTRLNGLTAAEDTWRAIAAGKSDPLTAVVIRP